MQGGKPGASPDAFQGCSLVFAQAQKSTTIDSRSAGSPRHPTLDVSLALSDRPSRPCMTGSWSMRHSTEDRKSSQPESPTYHEAGRLSRVRIDEKKQEVSDREAERLAEKIVSVGADYIAEKSTRRYGEEGMADDNAAPTMDPDAMANKLMKEAARELNRASAKKNDGQVFSGSDAARAQATQAAKDHPESPMHKVAEKVREKVEASEERFAHPHTFVGPNPDEGAEGANEKKRHMRNRGEHITGGLKEDRNPDVIKD
ncbi:hypothetical protein ABPG75_009019 [Micractinium tetrahymenae]